MKNMIEDIEEYVKDIQEKRNINYVTTKDELQRKYSYYRPNREFSGNMENAKLKKVDDGTFIDNGYR